MLVMNISESDVHITASSTVCCDFNVFDIQIIPGLVHLWDLVSAGCDVTFAVTCLAVTCLVILAIWPP